MKLVVYWYNGNDNHASLFDVQGEFFGPFGLEPEKLGLTGPETVINSVVQMPLDVEEISVALDSSGYVVVVPLALYTADWTVKQAVTVELP